MLSRDGLDQLAAAFLVARFGFSDVPSANDADSSTKTQVGGAIIRVMFHTHKRGQCARYNRTHPPLWCGLRDPTIFRLRSALHGDAG
jgi:hypothetical protein